MDDFPYYGSQKAKDIIKSMCGNFHLASADNDNISNENKKAKLIYECDIEHIAHVKKLIDFLWKMELSHTTGNTPEKVIDSIYTAVYEHISLVKKFIDSYASEYIASDHYHEDDLLVALLLDETILADEFYHHYQIVNQGNIEKQFHLWPIAEKLYLHADILFDPTTNIQSYDLESRFTAVGLYFLALDNFDKMDHNDLLSQCEKKLVRQELIENPFNKDLLWAGSSLTQEIERLENKHLRDTKPVLVISNPEP